MLFRSRVSFGRDVKAGISPEAGATATEANTTGNGRKSIQQRLEESRSNKAKKANEAKTSVVEATTATERPAPAEDGTDDDWEDDSIDACQEQRIRSKRESATAKTVSLENEDWELRVVQAT